MRTECRERALKSKGHLPVAIVKCERGLSLQKPRGGAHRPEVRKQHLDTRRAVELKVRSADRPGGSNGFKEPLGLGEQFPRPIDVDG